MKSTTSPRPYCSACDKQTSLFHGQPCLRAHLSTSTCPRLRRPSTSSCPTRSRSPWPTAEPPDARPTPRQRTSSRPTRIRWRAPTEEPPGGLPPPPSRTCPRGPRTICGRPTSAPRGGRPTPPTRTSSRPRTPAIARPLQHLRDGRPSPYPRTSSRPTSSRSRAPTSAPRGGVRCADAHVRPSHGQSFARAHFNTSRWPPFAASARLLAPRAVVFARPPQHLEVAALRAFVPRLLIPREILPRSAASTPRDLHSSQRQRTETVVRQSTSSAQTRACSGIRARGHRIDRPPAPSARSRPPPARMPLLTARSTARSAGSGRCFSTRKTATSKGKAGKATPACAQTPRAASATISRCAACTARVVVRAAPEIQDAKTRRQPYPFIVLAAWHIFWFLFFSSVRRGLMTRRAPPHVTRTTRADARAGGARVGRF